MKQIKNETPAQSKIRSMKFPKPKLSKNLSNRTKLTAEQLERVKGQAGGGRASVYDGDGVQSLALTRKLNAARAKAKRFVLYTDQLGRRLYVRDQSKKELCAPITFDKKEALHFFEGFDDPQTKVMYWNQLLFPLGQYGVHELSLKTTHA